MTHKCVVQNENGIQWVCYQGENDEILLESQGIPDTVCVSYCPFCGKRSDKIDLADDIIYQLRRYDVKASTVGA